MNLSSHPKAFSIALGAVCICSVAAGGQPMDARVADDVPGAVYERSFIGADFSADSFTELTDRSVTVTFTGDGTDVPPVVISAAEHQEWIAYDERYGYIVDERTVRLYLDEHPEFLIGQSAQAVAGNVREHGAVIRADIAGVPAEGYAYDTVAAARSIVQAFYYNDSSITVPLTYEEPSLYLRTSSGTQKLVRLSQGKSDFANSPYGRKANVLKALHERLQGIVIAPGEEFSFTDAMEGAVGWSDALVIVEGGKLVTEPGGGICQAATTAFRAALLAGLPVPEHANHSLYVTYYKAFGVGIDATYYPGKQDLTFVNDTKSPIVVLARDEGGVQAIVELYGIPDGRTVELDGPYIGNAGDTHMDGTDLKINQIGWTYDVTYPDGRVAEDQIISTYKALPKKLGQEFPRRRGISELIATSSGAQLVGALLP